jgi:hypothetical protein
VNVPPYIVERWPPIYDANALAAQINALVANGELFRQFYWTAPDDGSWCQGDIVHLQSQFPYIDSAGRPAVLDNLDVEFWLLLSNTCDLDRTLDTVRWAQLVPLLDLDVRNGAELDVLRRYEYSRRFYVPNWTEGEEKHFVADFTMPVTLDRAMLSDKTRQIAHLSQVAWVLLHSCLVRFLARDDGRFEAS